MTSLSTIIMSVAQRRLFNLFKQLKHHEKGDLKIVAPRKTNSNDAVDEKNLRPIENIWETQMEFKCFGCSTHSKFGLKLTFQRDDAEQVYSSFEISEHYTSFESVVHGGILAVVIDDIAFWTVFSKFRKIALTIGMRIEFKRVAHPNTKLVARGRLAKQVDKNRLSVFVDIFNNNETENAKFLICTATVDFQFPTTKQIERMFGGNFITKYKNQVHFEE